MPGKTPVGTHEPGAVGHHRQVTHRVARVLLGLQMAKETPPRLMVAGGLATGDAIEGPAVPLRHHDHVPAVAHGLRRVALPPRPCTSR